MRKELVGIHVSETYQYPSPPAHPSKIFPELQKGLPYKVTLDISNPIYAEVRELLYTLGLDKENFGTPFWNPFHGVIKKGQMVTIKPNLVRGEHPLGEQGTKSMVTNSAVIRPIVDYILLATGGDVTIVIGDVPLQSSDWNKLMECTGLQEMVDWYGSKGVEIELLDLRKEISTQNEDGVITERDFQERDPRGYTAVDIGKDSRLMPIIEHYRKFEITDYGKGTVPPHHNPSKNEYYIPNSVLHADVFINVPKLKTHRKAGLTCAMKNLIGINGDKRWLAHHRSGSKKRGGDEYEKFKAKMWLKWHIFAFLKRHKFTIPVATLVRKLYLGVFFDGKTFEEVQVEESIQKDTSREESGTSEGSWYGNDTIWRCIIDLNNILFFADKQGKLTKTQQRKYLCIVDGLLAGEREGPMEHTPKDAGILIAGTNPVAVDFAAAHVMGFDWKKVPQIREALLEEDAFSLVEYDTVDFLSNREDIEDYNLHFIPSKGWKGKVEKNI